MHSHAFQTIRVSGISRTTDQAAVLQNAREVGKVHGNNWRIFRGRPSVHTSDPLISLAPKGDSLTGTITFPSNDQKTQVLKNLAQWEVDDTFHGLTILHSAPEPDLDICAVHGLNGNAFDTWAWERRDMWLRDFLPEHRPELYPNLGNLRVMTFGYSSLLRDTKNATGLHEWSNGLLQDISRERRSVAEQSRPIIFVCHSLGGIVARQAMIQLSSFPQRYPGLQLEKCGFLFLGTPHSGTTAANWNGLLIEFAKMGGLRRADTFTRLLSAFNEESANAKDLFMNLDPIPPFECLYETQMTTVAGSSQWLVPRDSAALGSEAQPMLNADHKTICKFPNKDDQRYLQVLECLDRIRGRLVDRQHGPSYQKPRESQGGDAHGGHAFSRGPGGTARGGDALGGAATGDGSGGAVRAGGAWGGNAEGDHAVGGSATGGSIKLQ